MVEQRLYGVYRGTVYSNKDPLGQGRLRLKIPQVLGTQVSEWVWPVSIEGLHTELPEVNQGVWVMFEGGDSSFPIWFGVFGKDQSSDYPLSLERLSKSEDVADILDLLAVESTSGATKQLDVTQTLLNLARKAILAPPSPPSYYGAFHSSQTQTNPVANTPMAMTFNVTETSNGVSIVDNSKITIHTPGVYNLQFSAQLDKTDSGTDDVDIWMRHQGVDVLNSTTRLSLVGNNAKQVAAWNFFIDSDTVDQYWELMWASADVDLRLFAEPAQTTPFAHPGIPSVILTVNKVG